MISAIDDGVGQIMSLLRETGNIDNTLVMFTSDNGAPLGAHQGKAYVRCASRRQAWSGLGRIAK